MKKKLITATLLSVAALALVVASVLGTIAYLTSSSKVANVFTVGKVAIEMTEAAVDANGEAVPSNPRTDKNSYRLMPGKSYDKDPTIFIKNSLEDQDDMYLFVKSVNDIRAIEAGNVDSTYNYDTAKNLLPTASMRVQMEENGWVPVLRSEDGIEIVWVYGTRNKSTGEITPTKVNVTSTQKNGAPAGQFVLCSKFTVHEDANVSTYGGASVNFTAYAVQTTGLKVDATTTVNGTAKAAWDAIKESIDYEHGIINPVNPYDKTVQDPFTKVPNGEFNLGNND